LGEIVKRILGLLALTAATVLLVAGCTTPAPSAAPAAAPAVAAPENRVENTRAVPMSGALADGSGTVSGTFLLDRLVDQGGVLTAVGTFTGTVIRGAERLAVDTVDLALSVTAGAVGAVTRPSGGCAPLQLRLLPSTVSLLGVTIRFDPALVQIVSAPANLLGGLVCQVGNLLSTALQGSVRLVGGSAQQLLGLLNSIIGVLIDLG
jgi:hypothetical protein